ncbi:NADP-dependent oxidoreductase domain-containing protein [Lentinula aff. lateritia]|uniref:NADP-dependent oxidoreductase domain-containing protein n=1 Tax=Lentinula aff. lateritia TaxID=2804960 RepID=A0ACC1TSG9_9AGAR|nr:NADP-dependent oxidoreductase domain-containing protein [Lentinula aff. lateritia]
MNAYCNFNGIGLIPWAPVAGGKLCRPVETNATVRAEEAKSSPSYSPFSDADKIIIGRVEEIAKTKGWTMTQVALAWVNMKVTSPIVGMSSVPRVEENVITGLVLDGNEVEYLEEP